MKQILLFICLLGCKMGFAQTHTFTEINDSMIVLVEDNQWDAVLDLAPAMVNVAPSKGDGYYYMALAHFKLHALDKSLSYIDRSFELANAALKVKLTALYKKVKAAKNLADMLEYIEALEEDDQLEEAAEAWRDLWEQDKSVVSYAYKGAQLYIDLKMYEEALDILEDDVFDDDAHIQKVIKSIYNTPEMVIKVGYDDAMAGGRYHMGNKNYNWAIDEFKKALKYKPNDYDALESIEDCKEEIAWDKAYSLNTLDSYESYLNWYPYGSHYYTAMRIYTNTGERALESKDLAFMKQAFDLYLKRNPTGEEADRIKKLMCDAFYQAGLTSAAVKYESSQKAAAENFKNAKEVCSDKPGIDSKIKKAQKLALKYSYPSVLQMSFLYDELSTFGFSFGLLRNTGIGWYGTLRSNSDIMTSPESYTVNNSGALTNKTLDLRRTSSTQYANIELLGGITTKLFEPVYFHLGMGISNNPVYWEYEKHSASSWTPVWVKNTDQTSTSPVVESGLFLNLAGFIVRGGIKTLNFSEYYFTVGIGFTMSTD